MTHWLYQEILSEDSDREPQLALQSTVNWARSLASEICAEHGETVNAQHESCLRLFRKNTQGGGTNLGTQAIFEPLFSALTNTLSVVSSCLDEAGTRPWSVPGVIVDWYYATYTAMRSMLAANGIRASDTHSGVIKAVGSSLRARLPHPLNMQAQWLRNENFSKELPNYPGVASCDLTVAFSSDRPTAQGMLLGYLSGTRTREVGAAKAQLRKKHGFRDFRTKSAREIRDEALQSKVYNFMHCAFRYRGKANYRDAIYIAYGSRPLQHRDDFLRALAVSSKFMFVCALALIRLRIGESTLRAFLDDIAVNLRGTDSARLEELFWKNLVR